MRNLDSLTYSFCLGFTTAKNWVTGLGRQDLDGF